MDMAFTGSDIDPLDLARYQLILYKKDPRLPSLADDGPHHLLLNAIGIFIMPEGKPLLFTTIFSRLVARSFPIIAGWHQIDIAAGAIRLNPVDPIGSALISGTTFSSILVSFLSVSFSSDSVVA